MESSDKVFLLSATLALGLSGVAFLVLKNRFKVRDAVDAFHYLDIKNVTSLRDCDEVVAELRKRSAKHHAIGFDCEWVTNHGKRQPVALLQLSSSDGYCGLFRLCYLKTIPDSLKNLLESESMYKLGVAPADDAKYLRQDYEVDLKSTLDIRHIAYLCGEDAGGLAALAKNLLKINLDKSWRIRCSDWEAETLTDRQIMYAAADAHVSIKVFIHLVQQLYKSPLSWLRRDDVWSNVDELCRKYIDVSFKNKQKSKDDGVKERKTKDGKTKECVPKKYSHATRSKPLYHNCILEAPDGELLCTCDNKKAVWYVEKQLGDIVKEVPLTVRLRFEPAGRAAGDVGRYYQTAKQNRCVVCGHEHSYIRKNVVPREYRKFFPDIMKDHSSHDVLLLCAPCHQRSNVLAARVREQLAARCGAPLADGEHAKCVEDPGLRKLKSAARALLYQSRRHTLPPARRAELENIVLQHFPEQDELTEELLKEAAGVQAVVENSDYDPHGRKVVSHFASLGGCFELERVWREHFLREMRPRHLPPLWSTTHNEDRLRVMLLEGRLSEEEAEALGLTRS